ncbi:MAG TPA: sigma-70 family RNA polymerase sigma factor [Bacteroidota bacterium]|nr:sigma-70 family RNA polymerase sigma factor [Bacteroidota bacterium]
MPSHSSERTRRFEDLIVPHIAAAYNLARWITRSSTDAEDVVQEACLRAFRYFDGYKGGNSRAWFFAIVRNVGYSWLEKHAPSALNVPLNEDEEGSGTEDAESALHQAIDGLLLKIALDKLPVEFREAIVLRDMDGMSYKEIAEIANVPIGTVMSRIARGRKRLSKLVSQPETKRKAPDDLH